MRKKMRRSRHQFMLFQVVKRKSLSLTLSLSYIHIYIYTFSLQSDSQYDEQTREREVMKNSMREK